MSASSWIAIAILGDVTARNPKRSKGRAPWKQLRASTRTTEEFAPLCVCMSTDVDAPGGRRLAAGPLCSS